MSVYGRRGYGRSFFGGPVPVVKFSISGSATFGVAGSANPVNRTKVQGTATLVVSANPAKPTSCVRVSGASTITVAGVGNPSAGFFRWVDAKIFSTVQDPTKNGLVQGAAVRDHLHSRLERVGL